MTSSELEWKFRDMDWHDVEFVCKIHPGDGGSSAVVFVAGEFCGWNENEWIPLRCTAQCGDDSSADCTLSADVATQCTEFRTCVKLLEGAYQYKFVVNGEWRRDVNNPHHGGQFDNSVMYVSCDPPHHSDWEQVPITKPWNVLHREHSRPGAVFHTIEVPVPQECESRGVLRRPIFIYLPIGYDDCSTNTRFPVLYVLDGEDAFSTLPFDGNPMTGGWWLDKQLDLLTLDNATRPFIIVAIPNGDFVSAAPLRKREYCPESIEMARDSPFCHYLLHAIVPFVDSHYKTSTLPVDRVVLGFSMGGLLAFLLLWQAPEIFGKAISMSPSFWFHDKNEFSAYKVVRHDCEQARLAGEQSGTYSTEHSLCTVQEKGSQSAFLPTSSAARQPNLADVVHTSRDHPQVFLYLDCGDGEGDNHFETRSMDIALEEAGVLIRDRDYVYKLDERASQVPHGVTHCQAVARDRVHHALRLLLPPIGH